MDPDEALKNLRQTVSEYTDNEYGFCEEDLDIMMESLTQNFKALDGWLSGGGFLPADWGKGR